MAIVIKYKNNKYIERDGDLFIVAQAEPCPTVGSLIKVTKQTFAERVLANGTIKEELLSGGQITMEKD